MKVRVVTETLQLFLSSQQMFVHLRTRRQKQFLSWLKLNGRLIQPWVDFRREKNSMVYLGKIKKKKTLPKYKFKIQSIG